MKTRETGYFYGHPQNRFWKVLAALFEEPVPADITSRHSLLIRHHIAVWDSIYQCSITGSSDTSIKDVVPTDLSPILDAAEIRQIFCNGRKSFEMYCRYSQPANGRAAIALPSTSPANAAFSLDRLIKEWAVILDYL